MLGVPSIVAFLVLFFLCVGLQGPAFPKILKWLKNEGLALVLGFQELGTCGPHRARHQHHGNGIEASQIQQQQQHYEQASQVVAAIVVVVVVETAGCKTQVRLVLFSCMFLSE